MEHTDSYNVYKQMIQDGKYKKKMKRLAKELSVLRENGHITQEENNELMKLNSEILAKPE
jgi:hypothetical protein